MDAMGLEVAGGCNSFISKQREVDQEDGSTTHLVLSTFDDQYTRVRNGALADEVPITVEELQPRGLTALYDGIGTCLDDAVKLVNEANTPFDSVCTFILTDGLENASRMWHCEDIKARIEKLESDYGWEFFFAAGSVGNRFVACYLSPLCPSCYAAFAY